MTYSIESTIRAVAGFLSRCEQITRPPRLGHDDDLVAEPDYAYKALFDCTPEDRMLALTVECTYCGAAVGDQCLLDGRPIPMMFPGSGGVHPSRIKRGHEIAPILCPTDGGRCECDRTSQGCAAYHATQTEIPWPDPMPRYQKMLTGIREALDELGVSTDAEVPNPTEPSLSDDELVAVRGLIQERYEPDDSAAVKAGLCRGSGSPCTHRACQPYGICLGVTGAQMDFAQYGQPSASVIPTGADAEPNAPAEVHSAGSSGEGGSDTPPSPASPHPDDDAAEWVGWAVPAIWTALTPHEPSSDADGCVWCYHPDTETFEAFADWQVWREHIAPLIAEHIAQALPDYPSTKTASQVETGHDMSWAAETFPQHTNTKGTQ